METIAAAVAAGVTVFDTAAMSFRRSPGLSECYPILRRML